MTKMLDSIEAARRPLLNQISIIRELYEILEEACQKKDDEIATLREVNAAQAEQLRKAQERIRAAEAERDRAWNEAIEAAAQLCDSQLQPAFFVAAEVRSLAKQEAGE